jgi:hypothetical protein
MVHVPVLSYAGVSLEMGLSTVQRSPLLSVRSIFSERKCKGGQFIGLDSQIEEDFKLKGQFSIIRLIVKEKAFLNCVPYYALLFCLHLSAMPLMLYGCCVTFPSHARTRECFTADCVPVTLPWLLLRSVPFIHSYVLFPCLATVYSRYTRHLFCECCSVCAYVRTRVCEREFMWVYVGNRLSIRLSCHA